MGLVHADRHDQPRDGSERGDGVDRRGDGDQVGDDAGEERADGEASVAPQPVDADRACPSGGMGDAFLARRA